MLAGDKSTIIKTDNYDIKLAKQTIKDLVMNEILNDTKFPLEFQDIARLLEDTNITERSVLGLTVTCLLSSMAYCHPISFPEFACFPVRPRHTRD